ncbi:hypothetical protein ACFVHQ_22725, partial [Actinomycetes bacterium NPDC127524]
MEITKEVQETGTYVIQSTGPQTWPVDGATWRAPGVRLDLMDGRRLLATCKLECSPRDADDVAATMTADIEPWVRTLRYLAVVGDLREQAGAVERLHAEAEQADEWSDIEAAD